MCFATFFQSNYIKTKQTDSEKGACNMVSCNVFSTMHACIGDSTQLMTLPAAARSCQFIVNTLRHTNIVLDLLETTPIAELKARVADSEGIPPAKL